MLLLLAALSAPAQFAVTWSKTAGGGAMNMTGGVFSAGSTSGQCDTGVRTNGATRITGGFWAIMDADQGPPQLVGNGTLVSNLPNGIVASAEVLAHNARTYLWLEWGTTTNFGNSGPVVDAGRKFLAVNVQLQFTSASLAPGTTYYYRLVASNSIGVVYGDPVAFTHPLFVSASSPWLAVSHGGVAWGDYDNDGRLDLLLHGTTDAGRVAQIWRNTGSGVFTNSNAGLTGVSHGAAAWADYNNDGQLDLLLTGMSDTGLVAQVWRNTGAGFSNVVIGLPGVSNSAVVWADFNNDGRRDFLVAGMTATGRATMLMRNTGAGFSNVAHTIPGLDAAAIAAGDYDNDGYLDLYVQGRTNSAASTAQAVIWRNESGTFAFSNAVSIAGRSYGTASWGDDDGNDLIDLVQAGQNTNDADATIHIQTNGLTAFNVAGTPGGALRFSGAAWADYNADGRMDVALWGQRAGITNTAEIWQRRTDANAFSNSLQVLTGVAFGSGAWGDYDNDGRLDFLVSGATFGGSRTSQLVRGCSPSNAPPAVPDGLVAVFTNTGVTFAWSNATDALMSSAALTYNLRVGSSPGASDVFEAQADATNGFRRVAELGNVQMGTNAFLALTNSGIYFWSVQAIDNSFIPSAFAAERAFGIALPAFVTTQPPTFIDKSNATFNASINVSHTTAWFEYGTTTNFGSTSTAFSVGAITGATNWSLVISNLQPATIYYVRAVGTNIIGRENGSNIQFQTRGPAVALAVFTQPSSAVTAGVAFVQQPVVRLVDALGAVDTGAVHSVTVTTASGSGAIQGGVSVSAVTGTAVFSSLFYTNAGTFTVAFAASGLTGITSTPVVVNAAAAAKFVITAQPSAAATAGVAFVSQPALRVEDAFGNLVTNGNFAVSAGSVSNAAHVVGTTNTVTTNGLAAYVNLSYTNAGTFNLRFTNGTLSAATSTPVAVVAGFATKLVMSNQPPANAIAGAAFSPAPIVRIEDAYGNISLTSAIPLVAYAGSGPGPIVGTTGVTASAGLATFADLFGTNVGTYTLAFAGGTLQGVTSSAVTVRHAAVAKMNIQTQPSTVATAAVTFATQPVIRLEDIYGNLATGAVNQVGAGTDTGAGILQGSTNATMTNGLATFTSLNYTNAGAFTIRFVAASLASVTSGTVTVGANFARTLVMVTNPSEVATAGVAFVTQSVVRIEDGYGNLVTTGSLAVGSVTLGGGALVQGSTNASSSGGFASFVGQYYTNAGSFQLLYTAPGFATATSTPVTVQAAAAARLAMFVSPPATAAACAAISPSPVVRIEDTFGNHVTSAVDAVTACGLGFVMTGTSNVTASVGLAGFTNLQTATTGTGYRIAFDAAGLTSVTSSLFEVEAGTPFALVLLTNISPVATAGVRFAQQPSLAVYDACGNLAVQAAVVVTAAVQTGAGVLQGDTVRTSSLGYVTFTNLFQTAAVSNSLSFAAEGLVGVASGVVTTRPSYASQLAVAQFPSANATAGVAFATQPIIAVVDDFYNLVSTGSVTMTAASYGTAAVLRGPTTAVSAGGFATFTGLFFTNAGSRQIVFQAAGFAPDYSAVIAVAPAAVASMVIGSQPTSVGIGAPMVPGPVIHFLDSYFNVANLDDATVRAARVSGPGNLLGVTSVVSVAGVATFSGLIVTNLGEYVLSFSSPGFTTLNSSTITAAVGLAVQTQPSLIVTAGVVFARQPVVRVESSPGIVDSLATNLVLAQSFTGTGTLFGTATQRAVAGVATFTNLYYASTGTYTILFSTAGISPVVSTSVTVRAAAAAQFRVVGQPSVVATAGVAFVTQPVVRVEDAWGNLVITGNLSVTAAVYSNAAVLRGNTVAVSANGFASFTGLNLTNAGPFCLTFASATMQAGTSATVTVRAASPARIGVFVQPPGTSAACRSISPMPTVGLQDIYGNTVTNVATSFTAALDSGPGVLGGTLTVPSVAGLSVFSNLTTSAGAEFRLRFTAAGYSAVTSIVFAVQALPYALVIDTNISGVATAGVKFARQARVMVMDSCGNFLPASTALVTAATQTGPGTLYGDTERNAVGGYTSFTNLNYQRTGTHTVAFSSPGLVSVQSASVTVRAGPASALAMDREPSNSNTAGVVFPVQSKVKVTDAYGNLVTTGTYSLSSFTHTGPGILRGPLTASASGGFATFAGQFYTNAGDFEIEYAAAGLGSAVSATVSVYAAAATSLFIYTQASDVPAGSPFEPATEIFGLDRFNNPAGLLNATVTASKVSGPGLLLGGTVVTSVQGFATFTNLMFSALGAYRLSFASPGLGAVTSETITAGASEPYAVAVLVQPSTVVTAGVPFVQQPQAVIVDRFGNTIPDSTNAIFVRVYNGPGVVSGTLTAVPVSGVATFTNLDLRTAGNDITLEFYGLDLVGSLSSYMTVLPNPVPAQVGTHQEASAVVTAGVAFAEQPVVRVEDAYGNPLATGTYAVSVRAREASGFETPLFGNTNVTTLNGLGAYTNLSLCNAGTVAFTWYASLGVGAFPEYWTVAVEPNVATQLVVGSEPAEVTAGMVWDTTTVQLWDAYSNLAYSSTCDVSVSVASGPGPILGTLTMRTENGVARFLNLYATNAGTYVLRYSASGYAPVSGAAITVVSGPEASLLIATQASSVVTGGVPFVRQPAVRVVDEFGNDVSFPGSQVVAAIATGNTNALLTGSTNMDVTSGQAVYEDLAIHSNGSYNIRFSYMELPAVTSAAISVVVGPATGLMVVTQPSVVVTANVVFVRQPAVAVVDAGGNRVLTNGVVIHAAAIGPGSLLGTTNASSVSGLSLYNNLYLTNGGPYVLTFDAGDTMLVQSDPLAIPAPPTVATLGATPLNLFTQRVNGSVFANSHETTVWFEWGTNSSTYALTTTPVHVGDGVTNIEFQALLGGLLPGNTYYFRAVASNALGTTRGDQASFTALEFGLVQTLGTLDLRVKLDWADWNNDGLIDAARNTISRDRLYRNTGTNLTIDVNLGEIYDGDIAWGDFNRDGWVDLFVTGKDKFQGIPSTLAKINPGTTEAGSWSNILASVRLTNCVVRAADWDGDGRTDVAILGYGTNTMPGVMLRVANSQGNLYLSSTNILPGVAEGAVAFGDFDNDNDVDLFVSGRTNASDRISVLLRSDFTSNATLTAQASGLTALSRGDARWTDLNNDGWLDLVQIGHDGTASRGLVLTNNQNGTFTPGQLGFGLSSGGIFAGDYDNDGLRDLVVCGSTNGATNVWTVWRNTGGAFSNAFSRGMNAGAGGVRFVDLDNDGRLDVAVWSSDLLEIWMNYTLQTNSPPTAPTDLLASSYTGATVTLSWTASSDAQTPAAGLSYNVGVGTMPGNFNIIPPLSSAGGQRRIVADGNAGPGTTMLYRASMIGTGIFYWAVQAIDGAYAGSPFSTQGVFGVGLPEIPVTSGSTSVTPLSATMRGAMNFRYGTSRGWLAWGTNNQFGFSSTNVVAVNSTNTLLSLTLTNLERGMTYQYCAMASNVLGVITGAVRSLVVPIVGQGFEATNGDTWTIVSGQGRTNLQGSLDLAKNRRVLTGSWSWQPGSLGSGVQTLDLDEVNVSGYSNAEIVIRLSAAATVGNGLTAASRLQCFVATDGMAINTNQHKLLITGPASGAAYWSYDATNSLQTYPTSVATPTTWMPAGGGNRTALDGVSTVRIPISPGTKTVRLMLKSTLVGAERTWCVDDVRIEGGRQPDATGPTFFNFSVNDTNGFLDTAVNAYTLRVSVVDGPNGLSLASNKPQVTITNPLGQLVYGPTNAAFTGFAHGAEFIRMTNFATAQTPYAGTYQVNYLAYDLAGQASSTTFTFIITDDDNSPPQWTPRLVGAPAGWITTNQVQMSWDAATDNQGILEYRVKSGSMPTSGVEGVSLGNVLTQMVPFAEGITTNWFFAVDNDVDSPTDGRMSTSYPVVVMADFTPPAAIVDFDSDPVQDDATQIALRWAPLANAGGNYSPWASYDIYYTTNGTVPDTTSARFSSTNYASLGTNVTASVLLTGLIYDQLYRFAIAGRDTAGNIGPFSATLTRYTGDFLGERALVAATTGVQLVWNARTDVAYDVLYQDATIWRDSLSNNWQLLATVTNAFPVDTGSVTRTPPHLLGGSTMRFYRVANQDLWLTNMTLRQATREIFVAKPLVLVPGENWLSLITTPASNTVAEVFGTNRLPAGAGIATATRLSWYAWTNNAAATNVVWLGSSGHWIFSTGGEGIADDQELPLTQGFNIEVPGAATQRLVVLGRVVSQPSTFTLSPGAASASAESYNLAAIPMPRRTTIAESGLKARLTGGVNPTTADEIRVLNNAGGLGSRASPKYRMWLRSTDNTFIYTPGGASAEGHIFEPGDMLLIIRRHAGESVVTNRVYFGEPGKLINP